jgi:hypothetical protein
LRRLIAGPTRAEQALGFRSYVPVKTTANGCPGPCPSSAGSPFTSTATVPVYPASHGCVRQTFAVAHWTYNFSGVGMPVAVLAKS